MDNIIESFDRNKYINKEYDRKTSEYFLALLGNYTREVRIAVEPIYNEVFSKYPNIEIECIRTCLSGFENTKVFPDEIDGIDYDLAKYRVKNQNQQKVRFEEALEDFKNKNDGTLEIFLNYTRKLFDLAAYVKSLRFRDSKNTTLYANVFGVNLNSESVSNKLYKAGKLRNFVSHENRFTIENAQKAKTMLEQIDACANFIDLFSGNELIEKRRSNLNKYYYRAIVFIMSEPMTFDYISKKYPYFSNEERLKNTRMGQEYSEEDKTLYGHIEAELKILSENFIEDVSPLVTPSEKEAVIPFTAYRNIRLESLMDYDTKLSAKQIDDLTRNCPVFVDGRLFANQRGHKLLNSELIPVLKSNGRYVMVNYSSRLELNRMSVSGDEDEQKNALHARNAIDHLNSKGAVKYSKKQVNVYKNSYLETIEIANRYPKQNFFVIANDKVSADAIENETSNCLVAKPVGFNHLALNTKSKLIVKEFAANTLNAIDEEEPEPINEVKVEEKAQVQEVPKEKKKRTLEKSLLDFKECIPEDRNMLKIDKIPEKGEVVYAEDKKPYTLLNELGEGGEGTIFAVSDSLVAKVYKKSHLTKNRYKKLKLMIDSNISIRSLCWPKSLLFDSNECFVGYLMDKVADSYVTLGESIINITKPAVLNLHTEMKKWDRGSLAGLCRRISLVFEQIHKSGLIVGDINAGNILINLKNNNGSDIMLVDTDSFQVGPYPCPVGYDIFTSPEVYRREKTSYLDFGKILRTVHDEEYALASLLFQILMIGQVPFNGKGVENENLNALMEYNFAFRTKDNSGENTPDGPFRMIWNNTPTYIKNAFENVFTGKGLVSANEWATLFGRYVNDIKSQKFTSEITPYRYNDPKHSFTKDFECPKCHRIANLPIDRYNKIIENHFFLLCTECNFKMDKKRFKKIVVKCETCGDQINMTEYDYCLRKYNNEAIQCNDCKYGRVIKTKCATCGKPIRITREKYAKHGNAVYCPKCFEKVRESWKR